MNPRDTELARLTDVNLHRLIRRGTTLASGRPNTVSPEADEHRAAPSSSSSAPGRWRRWNSCNKSGSTRGISWGSGRSVIRSSDGRRRARFSPLPREPVRRRVHGIETFNVLRGGEYFFMPSISALTWIANLSG